VCVLYTTNGCTKSNEIPVGQGIFNTEDAEVFRGSRHWPFVRRRRWKQENVGSWQWPVVVVVPGLLSMWMFCWVRAARIRPQSTAGQASSGTRRDVDVLLGSRGKD
jgi:hypothetical protein